MSSHRILVLGPSCSVLRRFLTAALERMEMVDPPSRRDEENCNVRYRIEPAGQFGSAIVHQQRSSAKL